MDDVRLAERAAAQHGIVTCEEVRFLGLTDEQADRRIEHGLLVPVLPGVFRHAAHPGTAASRVMAAVIACRGIAIASHRSAAQLHDLRDVPPWRPEVTILGSRLPDLRGVTVHRTNRIDAIDIVGVDGIPTASVAACLLQLGAVVPRAVVRRATQDALIRHLVVEPDLLSVLERLGGRGRRGTAALREAVEAAGPKELQSRLEARLLRLIRLAVAEPPVLQHRLVLPDGSVVYLDFAWPDRKVAVEADGRRWHATSADFERDLVRSRGIAGAGWRHLRYGWADVHQRPDGVTAELRAFFVGSAVATRPCSRRTIRQRTRRSAPRTGVPIPHPVLSTEPPFGLPHLDHRYAAPDASCAASLCSDQAPPPRGLERSSAMERPLYSVDPQGQVSAGSSGPDDPNSSGSRRQPPKARPKFPVPTDRLKLDKQKEALRVICTASRNGQEPVDAEKMASLMGLVPATAALNNAFFVSVGLLKKVGKGDYLPTQRALDFQQKWTFNRAEAPKILAPAFEDSWFFDAVKQKVAIGQTSRDQMIETLAAVAYTDNSYATQYGFLLDWLEYVGLIKTDGGIVTLTHAVTAEVEPEVAPEPEHDAAPDAAEPVGSVNVAEKIVVREPKVLTRGPAVVSFAIDLQVTAEDLAMLTAEQIGALFEGAGKLVAIQTALAKG